MLQTKFQTTEISVLNILKQWRKILPQKRIRHYDLQGKQNVERTIKIWIDQRRF
jgi:hypothetical protein